MLASEAPDFAALLLAACVVALDGLLLVLAARRRSLGVAIRCGVVAMWFGSALGLALLLSLALMLRRSSSPFGWAVLFGSAQGFVSAFVVILAAFASAMGAD